MSYKKKSNTIEKNIFRTELFHIAIPVTLQCLLQSSFSVVDQVMTGQLGSISIAGIGLAGKFASIFSVVIAAVASAAGIMIAQYIGKKDKIEVGRSFYTNLFAALFLTALFMVLSLGIPSQILGLYTNDNDTVQTGVRYLRIYSFSFLPAAVTSVLSAYLRCVRAAKIPLYAGLIASVANTGLNYLLIFGKAGFPAMGVKGAALSSFLAQLLGCIVTMILFLHSAKRNDWDIPFEIRWNRAYLKQYFIILLPMLLCEFLWSLGENVYAGIYGHAGTKAFASMTLTNPLQSLVIGALSGISQAAGVMIGKRLGAGDTKSAFNDSKRLLRTGLICSVLLSICILFFNRYYVLLFRVEEEVRQMTRYILLAYAVVVPLKVQNMILGGILRSGGRTTYVMIIDLIGTWIVGVPLGMIAAFILHLPIAAVYFILSMEEGIRVLISYIVFHKKEWMQRL